MPAGRTATLLQLRTDARDRCDLGYTPSASTHITEDMLNRWIVQASRRYAGLLIAAYGERYFEDYHQFSTVVDQAQYDLPSDFYQELQFAVIIDGQMRPIYEAMIDDLAWGEFQALMSDDGCQTGYEYESTLPRWKIIGHKIEMVPVPTEIYCVKMRYVPNKIAFTSGGTAKIDMSADDEYIVDHNGWADFIVYSVCVDIKNRQDEDPTAFIMERDRIEREIKSYRNARSRGPNRIRNTYDRQLNDRDDLRSLRWR